MAQNNNNTGGGLNTNTVLIVGGVVVGGVLIYKIWDSIRKSLGGLSKDNEEAGVTISAWNPNYWKELNKTKDVLIWGSDSANRLVKQLANYQGIFSDNYNAVSGAIKQCKTKTQVSFLADKFFQTYNIDLYEFLKDGYSPFPWFGQGLSNDHLTLLNTYVKKLPDYKI